MKIERNQYHDFVEQVWLDADTVDAPVIDAGGHRMGFKTPQSDDAKCGGVYIFISEYWGKKNPNQIDIEFFTKYLIDLRGKHHGRHITIILYKSLPSTFILFDCTTYMGILHVYMHIFKNYR